MMKQRNLNSNGRIFEQRKRNSQLFRITQYRRRIQLGFFDKVVSRHQPSVPPRIDREFCGFNQILRSIRSYYPLPRFSPARAFGNQRTHLLKDERFKFGRGHLTKRCVMNVESI